MLYRPAYIRISTLHWALISKREMQETSTFWWKETPWILDWDEFNLSKAYLRKSPDDQIVPRKEKQKKSQHEKEK